MTRLLTCSALLLSALVAAIVLPAQAQTPETPGGSLQKESARRNERIRDRLWIWGHPAAVYNDSYLAPLGKKSTIEPVAAADWMGIRNMIFVRYEGQPQPPFQTYYKPFERLDRVYWSLVGAGGATSDEERQHVIRLAEQNKNIAGFILDDFFHATPLMWLAENQVAFPVTLTITSPAVTTCQAVELIQTDWPSGDYRSKEVGVEISADGERFRRVQDVELPNEPGQSVRLALPDTPFRMLRIQVRSTHDTTGAFSCGLKSVRLIRDGESVDVHDWQASASSAYPGFSAQGVLADGERYSAPLSPQQLRALAHRHYRGQRLPITAVVYARQISPSLKPYLDEVDQVSFWTWHPQDLDQLTANLAALEQLVPGKPVLLGCYMYDFDQCQPLSVERMKKQVEGGARWLRAGRIEGMIFLATPNVDVGLEAVEWTRQWITQRGDEPLRD